MDASYDDFAKLDMRVAKVLSVDRIPGRDRIVRGVIDIGEEYRTVIIGGADRIDAAGMVGRTVVALVNLEPRKIAGIESKAMLLAADIDGVPYWLGVDDSVPAGARIK